VASLTYSKEGPKKKQLGLPASRDWRSQQDEHQLQTEALHWVAACWKFRFIQVISGRASLHRYQSCQAGP
jgi:hypothetical protein